MIIGFVLLFMSKFIYACFWQIHFYMNQREITRLECINKDKPNLHCNGKCFLAKKLKMAEEHLQSKKENQSRSLQKLKSLEDTDGYIFIEHTRIIRTAQTRSDKPIIVKPTDYSFEPHHSIFHPPCL